MEATQPVHDYVHAIFDSRRWENFVPRDDDIVVATSMKAGTTWMQGIVASLLWPDGDPPDFYGELSPWLDARMAPIGDVLDMLDAQTHRRFIKTHTAADGIPLFPETRYVYVGRDGRDVFMSLINHWDKMRHGLTRMLNELSAGEAAELPIYDGDIHAAFDTFISDATFPWEPDGAPWWSHFHHFITWWDLRNEPNVLLVHYNDLLADLEGQMRRVAAFCGIDVPGQAWPDAVARCRFEEMREGAAKAGRHDTGFVGGAQSFFHKGSNGRWRGVLTEDQLARYDAHVGEVLPADSAAWLEHGSLALAGGGTP
jgi:aryl sulfotransferase